MADSTATSLNASTPADPGRLRLHRPLVRRPGRRARQLRSMHPAATALLAALLAPILLLAASGCAMTGRSGGSRLTLAPSVTTADLTKSLRLGMTGFRGPDGAVPTAEERMADFGRSDLEAMCDSVSRSLPRRATKAASLSFFVQHFALVSTENRVAGLAVVDWVAGDSARVLASERFYVAYDTGAHPVAAETPSMVKQRIMRAAATRIAERALAATNNLPSPPAPALTFDNPTVDNPAAVPTPDSTSEILRQAMFGSFAEASRLIPSSLPPQVDWPAVWGRKPICVLPAR